MEFDGYYSKKPLPEQRIMSRHQKKIRINSRRERAFIGGNLLSFLSGLSIGLLVAFIIFLRYQLDDPDATATATGSAPGNENREQTDEEKPVVEYTFYDTLRDKQVTISEWVARGKDILEDEEIVEEESVTQDVGEDQEEESPERYAGRKVNDDVSGYVLQVGSFRDFSSADQVKAQLALLGIFADIQRVMLNEQDVRHRVRLGPYKSVDEMQDIRRRLEDNQIEFMLLELRAKQDTT